MSQINDALRTYVTSASFTLTLGATHIAALVQIDHFLRRNKTINEEIADGTIGEHYPAAERGPHRRAFRHNATGMGGLCRRGLVIHRVPSKNVLDSRPDEAWEITEAGALVIGLLKEAGLWAEYGGAS